MKILKAAHLLCTLVLLAACSRELQIESIYEQDNLPIQYFTYGWLNEADEDGNEPRYVPDWMNAGIRKAVDERMQATGYWLLAEEPDLWVHYHVQLQDRQVALPQHYEHSYDRFWLGKLGQTYQYTEGMLMIDLVDAKTCELVWRGTATGPIDAIDADNANVKLREIVSQIFERFPGRARVPEQSVRN